MCLKDFHVIQLEVFKTEVVCRNIRRFSKLTYSVLVYYSHSQIKIDN